MTGEGIFAIVIQALHDRAYFKFRLTFGTSEKGYCGFEARLEYAAVGGVANSACRLSAAAQPDQNLIEPRLPVLAADRVPRRREPQPLLILAYEGVAR